MHFHSVHNLASIGFIAVMGFYLGQFFHEHKLPGILGWMLFGIILGPSVVGLITEHRLHELAFIGEITLGLAAFSIGTELRASQIKSLGRGVIILMFCQSFFAFGVVLAAIYWLTHDLPMALIFASLAPAISPAGTMAVIQECRAKGPLTTALFACVGVDDGLTVIIYAFGSSVARDLLYAEAEGASAGIWVILWEPLLQILESVAIGLFIGFLFSRLIKKLNDPSRILLILMGLILFASGLALTLDTSVILTNLFVGCVFANSEGLSSLNKVARQIRLVVPFFFVIFYGLAGAHLKLAALPTLGALGIGYIIARSLGLIIGSRVGATLGGLDEVIKKYLGPGVITQAGVAIGLALVTLDEFADIGSVHANKVGTTIITTITATSVLFEVIGPLLTKYSLEAAGEIGSERRRRA